MRVDKRDYTGSWDNNNSIIYATLACTNAQQIPAYSWHCYVRFQISVTRFAETTLYQHMYAYVPYNAPSLT